jgi:hypothetical protein
MLNFYCRSTSIQLKCCVIKRISHYSIDAPGQRLKVSVAYWAPTVMSVLQNHYNQLKYRYILHFTNELNVAKKEKKY